MLVLNQNWGICWILEKTRGYLDLISGSGFLLRLRLNLLLFLLIVLKKDRTYWKKSWTDIIYIYIKKTSPPQKKGCKIFFDFAEQVGNLLKIGRKKNAGLNPGLNLSLNFRFNSNLFPFRIFAQKNQIIKLKKIFACKFIIWRLDIGNLPVIGNLDWLNSILEFGAESSVELLVLSVFFIFLFSGSVCFYFFGEYPFVFCIFAFFYFILLGLEFGYLKMSFFQKFIRKF